MFAKLKFRNLLMYFANADFTEIQVAEMNAQFKKTLLDFGSETPDNQESVERIEVGQVREGSWLHAGLQIKDKKIRLSQLMHSIESIDLPEAIKAEYPALTREDWNAATRIMTLILISLEDDKWVKNKK
jgi:enoyl-[acyl-carrier-protein] reductase (NADH)